MQSMNTSDLIALCKSKNAGIFVDSAPEHVLKSKSVINKTPRAKFSDQRPSESFEQWQTRLAERRKTDAKRQRDKYTMMRQGAAVLAYQAIQDSAKSAQSAVFSSTRESLEHFAGLALDGKMSLDLAQRMQSRTISGQVQPNVLDVEQAITLALASRKVLGHVNGRVDESTGEVYVHEVRPCDASQRERDAIRLYLDAKFSRGSSPKGKVKGSFLVLKSKILLDSRWYNERRRYDPKSLTKAHISTTTLLTSLPYSDLQSRRTYNLDYRAYWTDKTLSPMTREEMFNTSLPPTVSIPCISRAHSRLSTRSLCPVAHVEKITTGPRIQATGVPIALEVKELTARAGYSYSAVMDKSQHQAVKTPAYWHTLAQHPTTVATGQVELAAQYALGRADGVYSVYPRPTTLK